METMFGVLLGYILRGTTGSEGFRDLVDSAKSVTGTQEFQNMIHAAKSHAAHVVRDVSETLSQGADQLADVLTAGIPAGGAVEPAEWETWPPPTRKQSRPFSEDVTWPDRS
jgi:hypothetical protein